MPLQRPKTIGFLAALAVRSTDADFARFPGVRWINPLAADD